MAGGSCGFCGARSRMDTYLFFYRRLLLAAPTVLASFGILRSETFGIGKLLAHSRVFLDLIIIYLYVIYYMFHYKKICRH